MNQPLCRICLKPESLNSPFYSEACLCEDGIHGACIRDLVELTADNLCHLCHSNFNVQLVPLSFGEYLKMNHGLRVNVFQKLLRASSSGHITLLAIFFLMFLEIDSALPTKGIITALLVIRFGVQIQIMYRFYLQTIANYNIWKRYHIKVMLENA